METRRQRSRWTPDEDDALRSAIAALPGPSICWTKVAPHVPGRTAKDCRKRWTTGLNTAVARGGWSREEDDRLRAAVQEFGMDWARVAQAVEVGCGAQR